MRTYCWNVYVNVFSSPLSFFRETSGWNAEDKLWKRQGASSEKHQKVTTFISILVNHKFFLWAETKREYLCYHIDNCADPRSLGDGETEKKWFYHHFELLFVEPLKIQCNFRLFDFLKCQYISLNRFMHHQFLLLSNTLDYKRTKKSFVGVNSTWKF